MVVKGKIKFHNITFYVEGPKVANAGYACEHANFGALCVACAIMLSKNKQELLDGQFERLGRVSNPQGIPIPETLHKEKTTEEKANV
jgi:hypothetical protein